MFESFGPRFFEALRQAAASRLGPDDPCLVALGAALASPGPEATLAVQEALSHLEPAVREDILARTHRALATDAASILAAWETPHRTVN